jgi:hypothetical protein
MAHFQAPKAASTIVAATPSGSGAFWTLFWIAWVTTPSSLL